jgi:hypothetical protein
MIIDALAKCGIRQAIKSLLSPRELTNDHTEDSTQRYVCARKRYGSGRKGRISVHRVSDERTDSQGRKVRLYTNVEGVDLDEDERQSFLGIEHTMSHNRGRSVKQKKIHASPRSDTMRESKVKLKKLAVKSHHAGDKDSDRLPESGITTPYRARHLSASSNEERDTPQPVTVRKHPHHKSRSGRHRRPGVVHHSQSSQSDSRPADGRVEKRTSRVERRVQKGREPHCSGALPTPQRLSRRPSLGSTLANPSGKFRTAATDHAATIILDPGKDTSRLIECDSVDAERNAFRPLETPGSPFRQPGLTPQESSILVFGSSSQMETRRALQAGRMDDRIAPDVHESVSQLVNDRPLDRAEHKVDACSLSRGPSTLDLEHTTTGFCKHKAPLESRTHALVNPSRTATSALLSKMTPSAHASTLHRDTQAGPPGFDASRNTVHGAARAQMSRVLPERSLQHATSGVHVFVHAQANASSDRCLSAATPGTPPYTPEKGDTIRK